MSTTPFQEVESALASGGIESALDVLAEKLRSNGEYHELFEARKLGLRHRLGLPLLYDQSGDMTDEQQRQLEEGLIEACRESGLLLIEKGKIRESWAYLRPIGENSLVAGRLRQIPVNDENMEELIEVLLYEGVDPSRGFQLILEHYGTCNAITTYEGQMYQKDVRTQQKAAEMILRRVHGELIENVIGHISREEDEPPAGGSLGQLLQGREWITADGNYHVDTSHLASTVRISRVLEGSRNLELSLDLTDYGRRLDPSLQYPGEEPFTDVYASHGHYFEALLGRDVPAAVDYFRQRAEQVDVRAEGTVAVEVLIQLLARIGRYREAIDATLELIPEGVQTVGLAPSLLELSSKAGHYQPMLDACQRRDDLLGYAACLATRATQDTAKEKAVP